MESIVILCSMDIKKFRNLLQAYMTLFSPAAMIRGELEEGEFVNDLLQNFDINPLDTNPFRNRQYNLMAHTHAITDMQNFLLEHTQAMLKELGFTGSDLNEHKIPCDLVEMRRIWDAISKPYAQTTEEERDAVTKNMQAAFPTTSAGRAHLQQEPGLAVQLADFGAGIQSSWADLAFDGADPVEELLNDTARTTIEPYVPPPSGLNKISPHPSRVSPPINPDTNEPRKPETDEELKARLQKVLDKTMPKGETEENLAVLEMLMTHRDKNG